MAPKIWSDDENLELNTREIEINSNWKCIEIECLSKFNKNCIAFDFIWKWRPTRHIYHTSCIPLTSFGEASNVGRNIFWGMVTISIDYSLLSYEWRLRWGRMKKCLNKMLNKCQIFKNWSLTGINLQNVVALVLIHVKKVAPNVC